MSLPVRAKAFLLLQLLGLMAEVLPGHQLAVPYFGTMPRRRLSREDREALKYYLLLLPIGLFVWLCVEHIRMAVL